MCRLKSRRFRLLQIGGLEQRNARSLIKGSIAHPDALRRFGAEQNAADFSVRSHALKLLRRVILSHDAEELAHLFFCGHGMQHFLHPGFLLVIQIEEFALNIDHNNLPKEGRAAPAPKDLISCRRPERLSAFHLQYCEYLQMQK